MNFKSSSIVTELSDTPSLFAYTNSDGEQGSETLGTLTFKLNQLKRKIQADRVASIKEKVLENQKKIEDHIAQHFSSVVPKNSASTSKETGSGKMLLMRVENPLRILHGIPQGFEERDVFNHDEIVTSTTAILPLVEKIPPYTTWIYLDKNQRMAEDQSVVGRRRIYYDPHGSEALICSDSEEEIVEPEEEKHEFSEGEDRILRMIAAEYLLDDDVFKILAQFVGGTHSEILERCNTFQKESEEVEKEKYSSEAGAGVPEESVFLGKSLSASLETFDNLFCRRCLAFDCRLHGCSQVLINATDKQPYSFEYENHGKPCGDHCFLQLRGSASIPEQPGFGSIPVSESEILNKGSEIPVSPDVTEPDRDNVNRKKRLAAEPLNALEDVNMVPDDDDDDDDLQGLSQKKSKSCLPNAASVMLENTLVMDHSSTDTSMTLVRKGPDENENAVGINIEKEQHEQENIERTAEFKQINSLEGSAWKPLEKELYLKGLEMFGKNSCLIARNLLLGLKTCIEVSRYMDDDGSEMPRGFSALGISCPQDHERKMPGRSRLYRKRGRTRKLKYSWKSAGHPSIWRRIADGKNQSGKLYTPCGCESSCGKECSCLQNATCCEKYCGCSKSCKNRFRGCHCAKSQCRSRQCPCFAAGRECDPDVCRNCWVSCGDGSLGEPRRRGDGQCGNMRLLLKQHQRILLAKSDVAGWGAFLKNPVSKNDYLGEYTGELVSHREADKRGKIYDRANSSFLFDLNDQYVLDAYRKGDKLKFANHSSNPNCYAKVMMVAGDHRVGIFANERIEAGEELFYDYRYNPDQAPSWARKPEGSKRDEFPLPHGRAKKHQSH